MPGSPNAVVSLLSDPITQGQVSDLMARMCPGSSGPAHQASLERRSEMLKMLCLVNGTQVPTSPKSAARIPVILTQGPGRAVTIP